MLAPETRHRASAKRLRRRSFPVFPPDARKFARIRWNPIQINGLEPFGCPFWSKTWAQMWRSLPRLRPLFLSRKHAGIPVVDCGLGPVDVTTQLDGRWEIAVADHHFQASGRDRQELTDGGLAEQDWADDLEDMLQRKVVDDLLYSAWRRE